ncbi:D-alanyl-D-alanine carboxypeptidase [Pelagibacteraceae bacterium]|nr:D-alanyl-D-alanine carboxypeptidase [Pelagibacteraceae bacterium]
MHRFILTVLSIFLLNSVLAFASYIDTDAETAVVIDATTGKVLFEKDKDKKTYPASMTKIMTTLIVFEKLSNGTLSLDDTFLVSEKAWKEREGSSMFVEVDKNIRVEDLLRGIIVQSGNDACIVVAENIAGTEESFAKMMTEKAIDIGMTNTKFANSTGMHDKNNFSTAYDLAILSQYLINNYPEYYHMFAETEFEWSNIKQKNRNPLLYKNMGVDGLKTGHLSVSGYGLAASAIDGDRRVISVTNGFSSTQKRSQGSSRLITWSFREFENIRLFEDFTEFASINIPGSNESSSLIGAVNDIVLTVPRTKEKKLHYEIELFEDINFPITSGDIIGKIKVDIPNEDPEYFDVVSVNDVNRSNIFSRFFSYIYSSVVNLFI